MTPEAQRIFHSWPYTNILRMHVFAKYICIQLVDNDKYICRYTKPGIITGGNRTMVAAVTIVSMAAAKKAQQNVFALYHSYNRTILLGFIWILDFHFKIVLVLRRRYLIPIQCNNGKRKCGLDDVCTILIFSADDGCTRWWRWLHYFGRVIFDTHTAPCRQIYL